MNARTFTTAALAAAALAAAPARAQDGAVRSDCQRTTAPQRYANDLCQKAVDIFSLMAPQLGTSIAGGNAVLGTGGNIGGFGHFTVGLRMNAVRGTIPDFEEGFTVAAGDASNASPIPTRDQFLGAPSAEAAISLFNGVGVGPVRIGGLDAIVSANYIPSFSGEGWELNVDNPLRLGFGGRLGILKEGLMTPGVAVSYLERKLPVVDFVSEPRRTTIGADTIALNDLNVKTSAWRLTVSKGLPIGIGAAAGVGQDRYDMSTRLAAVSRSAQGGVIQTTCAVPTTPCRIDASADVKMTRLNYFLDLSLNLPVLKIVAEIGQVSGGDLETYNRFDDARADDSRLYGSIGLRLGFPPF